MVVTAEFNHDRYQRGTKEWGSLGEQKQQIVGSSGSSRTFTLSCHPSHKGCAGYSPSTTPSTTSCTNLCYSLSCLKEEAKLKELDEKQSSLLCVLCFEHFCVTERGLAPSGESNCIAHTPAVSPPGSLPSPPHPTSIFLHTGRASPLGPHASLGPSLIGSRTDNAVSHLPLLLINEFLKYLLQTFTSS